MQLLFFSLQVVELVLPAFLLVAAQVIHNLLHTSLIHFFVVCQPLLPWGGPWSGASLPADGCLHQRDMRGDDLQHLIPQAMIHRNHACTPHTADSTNRQWLHVHKPHPVEE